MKYRAEIDGLRALAVLPVILFHAGFEWFNGGFVGVDVFFVISGYLIATIIISEMAKGKFSIVNFYERRARRILPVLFFVMAACLPFAWLWLTPNELKDFGQSLVAVSTFSSNILFWLKSGYFATGTELMPLIHTWSLAVEEQYYILFPIFLVLTWRLGIKWVLVFLSIAFLISLGVTQWGAFNKPSANFYLLHTRGWELLIGVFAAFYLKYSAHLKSHFANQMLSLLGFGMITYSIIFFNESTPFPSFYTLIPTIGTGLLILCAVPKTLVYKVLSLKFIVGIGLISYSAYLWHQPLLAFARHRLLGDVSNFILIGLCVTSLALAWFSWKFVEAPFREKDIFNRKSIFYSSALSVMIFCALGLFLHMNISQPDKVFLSEKEISIPIKYKGFVEQDRECSFPNLLKGDKYCEIFGEGHLGEVIIIGDSHARALSESFYSSVDSFSSIIDLTASGCPFILHSNIYFGRDLNCSSDYQLERQKALIEKPDSTVVYQARLPLYFYGNGFNNEQPDGKEIRPPVRVTGSLPFSSVDEEQKYFIENLKNTLEFIANNNKTLFLVLPSFSNGWNPVDKLFTMEKLEFSLLEARDYLNIPKEVVNQRVNVLRAELLLISKSFNNVITIDPNEYFCSQQFCSPLSEADELLFADQDHFSLRANNIIFTEVQKSMEALQREIF
jgi:peptidoglycan/LPS O-acetylase OafA/YrhL